MVINDWCHATAVKKVMGKGINFLEGGPGKVVDLIEKEQGTINYLTGRVLEKVYQYIIKIFKAKND